MRIFNDKIENALGVSSTLWGVVIGAGYTALNSPTNGAIIQGNVGIGTVTPTQFLHVQGPSRLNGGIYDSNNSVGSSGNILSSTGSGIAWSTAVQLGVITGSGTINTLAKFTPTGVQIGNSNVSDNGTTVTVSSDLSVIGVSTFIGLGTFNNGLNIRGRLIDANLSSGSSGNILSSTASGIAWSTLVQLGLVTGAGSATQITYWNSANQLTGISTFVYSGIGSVGIGTATPLKTLHVQGDGKFGILNIGTSIGLDRDTGTRLTIHGGDDFGSSLVGAVYIRAGNDASDTGTGHVYITGSRQATGTAGNIYLGYDPDAAGANSGIIYNYDTTYFISGAIFNSVSSPIVDRNTSSGTAGQLLTAGPSGSQVFWSSPTQLGLVSGTGSATQMAYWNNNNQITGVSTFTYSPSTGLGIGVANATETLDVRGDAYIRDFMAVNNTMSHLYRVNAYQNTGTGSTEWSRRTIAGFIEMTAAQVAGFPYALFGNATINAGVGTISWVGALYGSCRDTGSQQGVIANQFGFAADVWKSGTGFTTNLYAGSGAAVVQTSSQGTVTRCVGVAAGAEYYATQNSTITTMAAFRAQGYFYSGTSASVTNFRYLDTFSDISAGYTTITNFQGVYIRQTDGTVKYTGLTNNYGIYIEAFTKGVNNYAIYIAGAAGTPSDGITIGADTNIYRSAANTLKTDDSFVVTGGLNVTGISTLGITTVTRFSAALRMVSGVVTLTDGATVALDASLGNTFLLTAAGNRTILAPTNAFTGQTITIAHTASGADRTLSLTTGSAGAFRFGTDITGITTTTSGLTDYIGAKYNASADRWDVVSYVKGF